MSQRTYHVFISYGRAHSKAFVMRLNEQLLQAGFKVWVDFTDIPLGVDFQNQIDDGIEKADNFLFVISPHSVNSVYCRREIEQALKYSKRIIPLLHIPEIDQTQWQQAHPQGTVDEWRQYQAQKLHFGDDRNPNLHPTIAKINWLPFIETVHLFDDSLQQLLDVFERHQDYVQNHTRFLLGALEWERNQKHSHYLLSGNDYKQAESWLKFRFQDEQPPCIPTDLHCEYIIESIKYNSDLMTQIFLCYAEEDDAVTQSVRRLLMRHGVTVWTNKIDIKKGDQFQEAINRGIEEADNIVYLLSPNSLRSTYCQQELSYALSLNKRIIPLLVRDTDWTCVSPTLQSLQYIDITEAVDAAGTVNREVLQQQADQLLRLLQQDAIYYTIHKFVLAKALMWERQQRNTSILLRGHNLQYAEGWLKAAKLRSQHVPTPLQETFINASSEHPPEQYLEVFVSYSRVDTDFARRLNNALQRQGKTTWFDQQAIAAGTDFQQEIYRGIETCNHFLFIISPDAIQSPYCAGEVEYAQKLNKRIVTVVYRPVEATMLPPGLAAVQWIDFNRYNHDFYANFSELLRVLDTDQEHLRLHTRLLGRALEWEQAGGDPSFLLRGTDLVKAEQWFQEAATKTPPPLRLQRQYIQTSRKSPLRSAKPRTVVLTSLVATLFVLGLRFSGLLQPFELKALDHLMLLPRNEAPDPRLLVVEITEADIQTKLKQKEKGLGTLSDESLNRLLEKLERHQPRLIGLDLFRDFETDASVPGLVDRLRQNQRFIGVCKLPEVGQGAITTDGIAPPVEVSGDRIGFADINPDPDHVVRRQALRVVPPNDRCTATQSFGFVLARRYLELEPGKAISYQDPVTSNSALKLGTVSFQRLEGYAGGYQAIDTAGYQVLLNYRAPNGDPTQIAEHITLSDVLNDPISSEKIADRIVLIGITSKASAQDIVTTPYKQIPGVYYQAQVTSQIISATLNGRSLLWRLPLWSEVVWLLFCALGGGSFIYYLRSPRRLGIAGSLAVVGLYLVGVTCFVFGNLWTPIVPSVLVLLLSGSSVLYLTNRAPHRLAHPKAQPIQSPNNVKQSATTHPKALVASQLSKQ
ncbi:MAG: TIR domain-containing protein [Stenomitos rutilans HA7619-LM2]|jgi:CHASE2 domain-containing sensor protein|nr:TIR domain-containing protein [Stenomitos rutilans HA7619-LM2]